MIAIHELLGRLKKVKKTSPTKEGYPQWKSSCPCHNDIRQSLYIALAPRRILLNCFAGCAPEDIVHTLGLQWQDLFLDSNPDPVHGKGNGKTRTPGKEVARYRYNDPSTGNLLYEIVRYETEDGKTFRVFRNGKEGLQGVQPVLYHLDLIRQSLKTDPDRPIVICEGEKDADNAMSVLGWVATTNPFGAGSWRSGWGSEFAKANVVIFPDNDEAGIRHANNVARDIESFLPKSLKIVFVPKEHKDISDWIEALKAQGKTKDEIKQTILARIEETEQYGSDPKVIGLDIILSMRIPETRWLIEGLLPDRGLILLAGKPKSGKSWLALQLACAIATEDPIFSFPIKEARKVLFLALEDPLRVIKKRISMFALQNPDALGLVKVITQETPFPKLNYAPSVPTHNEQDALAVLERMITKGSYGVVVIDPLALIRPAPIRGLSDLYQQDYEIIHALQNLANRTATLILLVHHTRKAESIDNPFSDILGSTGLQAASDGLIILKRKRGTDDANLFITGKEIEEKTLALRFDEYRWRLLNVDEPLSEERRKIFEAIKVLGGKAKPKDIADYTGLSRPAVRQLLIKMLDAKVITRNAQGVYSLPFDH
jgi:DNA-binding transcriptional ArsR family regulator